MSTKIEFISSDLGLTVQTVPGRYWVSWWQPGNDPRPLTYPPADHRVLGWWESGSRPGAQSVCAVIQAGDDATAREAVVRDWPESASAEWRFTDPQPADFLPNDRFPMKEWMLARVRLAEKRAAKALGEQQP